MGIRLVAGLALALCGFMASAQAATVYECRFADDGDMKGWNRYVAEAGIKTLPDNAKAVEIRQSVRTDERGTIGLSRALPAAALSGRRVKITAELKGEGVAPAKQEWNGAKFMVAWKDGAGKEFWPQAKMRQGTFDWETVSFTVTFADQVKEPRLIVGFQDSFGTLWVRNLKVETLDAALPLAPVANMGLKDEVEGDGKGGWSDQGPDNDGANFPLKQRIFANVPFTPVDPAANNGKAILVFKAGRFPVGLAEAAFDLKAGGQRGRYLYLLHTLCWGAKAGDPVGAVDLTDADGKTRSLPVTSGRDVADWWNPKALPNGPIGASWTTVSGGRVGMYVSRFDLGENAPAPERLTLRPTDGGASIWIVAGATLSDTVYPFPESERFTTRANDTWKPLSRPDPPTIVAGSALDRSGFLPVETAGGKGRVIVNDAGHLAFASAPGRAVRFFSGCDGTESFMGRGGMTPPQLDTHEKVEQYVRELRANGYNMTRLHFLDSILMRGAKEEAEFNPDMLDRFEYLVHCLKQNGIYLNLDAMSSWTGYTTVGPWGEEAKKMRDYKFAIHFDEDVRANWIKGVEKILTRVNPYTKTKLADDPMLALVIGFNEQEFAFIRVPADPGPAARARWQAYLRQRYPAFADLKTAWGDDAPKADDFSGVPFFARDEAYKKSKKGEDIGRFTREVEIATAQWYASELRRIGYPGLVSAYNMAKHWHYVGVRNHLDAVTMNSYHAHPSNYMQPGSTISQDSSVGGLGTVLRWEMSGRVTGKPFLVTEYANTFWNRYRYEQAFVNAGYGAFQDFDALTAFAQTVNIVPVQRMHPFNVMYDPIQRASEFLSFFLFVRGDVRPADTQVRIVANLDDLYKDLAHNDGLSGPQSKLCLVTGLSVAAAEPGVKAVPAGPREVLLPRTGGGTATINEAGFSTVADDATGGIFDPDAFIADLKARKLLPADNRTVPTSDVFESSTGELFLDARKRFLSVKTPRLQGVCAEAGTTADLGALRVDAMTVKGNLALVSVDSDKPLAESSRMVLVFATDALNNNMVFDEKEMLTLRDIGGNPTLLETGAFTVTVRHPRAAGLKLWALELSGRRGAEVARAGSGADAATFTVDTAALPGGPSPFFELAVE